MGWAAGAVSLMRSNSDLSQAPVPSAERAAEAERIKALHREHAPVLRDHEGAAARRAQERFNRQRQQCFEVLDRDLTRVDTPTCCGLLSRPVAKFYRDAERLRSLLGAHRLPVPPAPEPGGDPSTLRAWLDLQRPQSAVAVPVVEDVPACDIDEEAK